MLNGNRLLGPATRRFAAAGAAFGLLFPIVATGIRILMSHLPLSLDSIFEVQRLDPLLWIIDTAPFFLGIFAAAAGHRQDALQQANHQLRALSRELQLSTEDRGRELAERTAQLGVSLEVGRAITSILAPDDLFRQVAQLLVARFNYYYAAVFVLDDEGGHAVLREAAGPADAVEWLRQSGRRLKIDGQSMVGASVVGKAPRVANRVQDDPVWFAHPALPETRSEIALPLIVGERALGALDVQSREVNAFDDSTVAMLQGLADQIAVALNNAAQFQSAQIIARQSTALFEAGRLAGFVDDDLPTAANNLLASVSHSAGFDDWLAVTVDAATDTYTVLGSRAAVEHESLPRAGQAVPAAQVAGLPFAQAIRLRQPIIVEDPEADPRLAGLPLSVRQTLANTVSAPAMLGERVVGAVSLGRSGDTTAITLHDVQLAQAIANQLAVTIHNRRLFDQAQATADELSALMRRYTHEGWARFEQARGGAIRHEYSQAGSDPLAPEVLQQVEQAVRSPDALPDPIPFDGQAVVGIPVALRGEVIGTLGVQADKDRRWSPDELVTLKAVADQVAQSIEVARLLSETENSLQETTELYRASRAMAGSTTPAEVMRTLVITLRDWLSMAQVRVVLCDEERGYGTIAAEAAPTPGIESARIPMAGNPVYDTLAATRQPLAIEDPALSQSPDPERSEGEGHPPSAIRHLLSAAARSALFVPLLVGQRLTGWIAADTPVARRFLDKDIAFCETLARQAAVAIENRRLFEATRRRAEIETGLNQISQTIKASLDPQAVLDLEAAMAEIGRVMNCSRSFYLANEDDVRWVCAYEWRAPGVLSLKGQSAAWDDLPHLLARFKAGEPLVTDAVEHDDLPDVRELMRVRGARAHVHVPVLTGNRLIGILGFDQVDHARHWRPEEVSLTQRVADQLAGALENARLYQNVRSRVNELTALTRIGRRLAATLELDEVLHTIVEEAVNITPANRGSIALYDAERDALEVRVLLGFPEEALSRMRAGGYDWLRRGEGLHGRLIATGQVVRSGDVQTEASYLGLVDDTRSELIVPIKRGDALLGALNLESPRLNAFDQAEQRLIEALADQAAVAIINARAYQSERAALEKMREVDRLKTQFLANMSHELRTPLNSIIGFSRVILRGIDGPLTELQQSDLTAIHNSGQHLLGLINDILDISKIEAGKMELSKEDIDLHDIVKGVMSTAIALVKDKPVQLRTEIPDQLPPIQADARRVRQVILNLVSNAAKFTEKGHIVTRVEAHPREVEICVSDTGTGIPDDKLEHIFEEFTQVDASTTRKAGGTGLGLAITRRFVELHGGRIWVESQIGLGSSFTFTLPLSLPEAEPEPPPDVSLPEPGKKLVVSIDDDPGVITLYRRYLEKRGYQVIGLTDASRAVEEVKRLRPFAITLDVMMPNRDGWAVLAELKTALETSRIPIVVCSIIEDESKGFALGAADYLVKPITEAELLRALERVDHRSPTQTVLVIDDEPDAVRLVRRMLEARSGFRVLEASGGALGIASVQADRPDVVLLDLMMPDVDGFSVLENIKTGSLTHNIPVIVITAKELTNEDRARLDGKVTALLKKGGLDSEQLLAEIASALGRLSQERKAATPTGRLAEQPQAVTLR